MSTCFSNTPEKITIKLTNIIGNFLEVHRKNQAENINKTSEELGKKLETFSNSLTAYSKAKSSTGVVRISINPNKKKLRAAAINVSPRNTSRANVNVDVDVISRSQEATDMREGKRKRVKTFNTNKKKS